MCHVPHKPGPFFPSPLLCKWGWVPQTCPPTTSPTGLAGHPLPSGLAWNLPVCRGGWSNLLSEPAGIPGGGPRILTEAPAGGVSQPVPAEPPRLLQLPFAAWTVWLPGGGGGPWKSLGRLACPEVGFGADQYSRPGKEGALSCPLLWC